jgi:acetylglutamate kinase
LTGDNAIPAASTLCRVSIAVEELWPSESRYRIKHNPRHSQQRKCATIVVKGGAGVDLDAICEDVAGLIHASAMSIVLVHGTSAAGYLLAARLERPRTLPQSLPGWLSAATRGSLKRLDAIDGRSWASQYRIVYTQARGVTVTGLNGLDGKLLFAYRKDAVRAIDPIRV